MLYITWPLDKTRIFHVVMKLIDLKVETRRKAFQFCPEASKKWLPQFCMKTSSLSKNGQLPWHVFAT